MENGIEALGAIRGRLQGRDEVLTHSLELLAREQEIIRREIGLVEQMFTLEQERVAMEGPALPPTKAAHEPEPTAQAVLDPEPDPAPEAKPEPVLTAVHVVPDAPASEAPNLTMRRVEALERLRATLAAERAVLPDLAPSPALHAGLLRRAEHLQHSGRP
jgi:hypothetical protein